MGKRRLDAPSHAFEHPHAVHVRYRSFERDAAAAPARTPRPRRRRPSGAAALDRTGPAGRRTPYRPAPFDAHRLMHLGLAQGGPALQAAVAERMFAAHFCEGKALDDPRVLQRLGPEAGLDEHRVAAVLAGDEYASAVRADEEAAGCSGRPCRSCWPTGGSPSPGPQPVDALLGLLRQAWEAREAGGSSADHHPANLGVVWAGAAPTWGSCRLDQANSSCPSSPGSRTPAGQAKRPLPVCWMYSLSASCGRAAAGAGRTACAGPLVGDEEQAGVELAGDRVDAVGEGVAAAQDPHARRCSPGAASRMCASTG